MNKDDVVYIYNGVLLSHKKEQDLAICNSLSFLVSVPLARVSVPLARVFQCHL